MKFKFFKKFSKKSPEKNFEAKLQKLREAAEARPDDIRINLKIAEHYLEAKKKRRLLRHSYLPLENIRKKN
jgi:predicted DNA binding CopG/RHH family protein